jgi:hypothetical protein
MDVQCRRRGRLFPPALWALLLVLGLASTTPAQSASGAIVRCVTADGATIYTDQACGFSGAKPAPMSTGLITRLVSEARIARAQGMEAILPLGAATDASPPAAITRRPAADGCARTPRQLANDLRGSLVLGDVNRLAESYHWVGMHSREGKRTLDRLAHLLGHPAVDTQYYAAQVASISEDDETRGGDGGILQVLLAGQGAPSVIEFNVQRYEGCYFVRFPSDGATIA